MFEKYFCSSSMPSFVEILPRTGPQFAFTVDFNDDDESLKRLDTLDTLHPGAGSWGSVVSEVLMSNIGRGAR